MAKDKKPVCKLVGEDGNVFSIIGRVCRALRNAGQPENAIVFRKKAMESRSYDDVLRLAMQYTEVE